MLGLCWNHEEKCFRRAAVTMGVGWGRATEKEYGCRKDCLQNYIKDENLPQDKRKVLLQKCDRIIMDPIMRGKSYNFSNSLKE